MRCDESLRMLNAVGERVVGREEEEEDEEEEEEEAEESTMIRKKKWKRGR